jgi:FkbM family methyltransferase
MDVEPCCTDLLTKILPNIDSGREGICLDVGVGTFAFYCETFARLGFETVAVEPLPIPKLRQLCQDQKIRLIEACLSNRNGTQSLYVGRFANVSNQNFNSLAPDWFGSSQETRQVKTMTLSSLLQMIAAQTVTCLKLDIEGWESVVIQQFIDLPDPLRPKVTMFEYGGGASRKTGDKGWSPKFWESSLQCLRTLQQCGYGFSIMVDYSPGATVRIFDLQAPLLSLEELFPPDAVYGNIISFVDCRYSESDIGQICARHTGRWINWLVNRFVAR